MNSKHNSRKSYATFGSFDSVQNKQITPSGIYSTASRMSGQVMDSRQDINSQNSIENFRIDNPEIGVTIGSGSGPPRHHKMNPYQEQYKRQQQANEQTSFTRPIPI